MYTQLALNAAALGQWNIVYSYLQTGTVNLNAVNLEDKNGQFTLLDYAHMQNQTLVENDLRQHGALQATTLTQFNQASFAPIVEPISVVSQHAVNSQKILEQHYRTPIISPKPFRAIEDPEQYRLFLQGFPKPTLTAIEVAQQKQIIAEDKKDAIENRHFKKPTKVQKINK